MAEQRLQQFAEYSVRKLIFHSKFDPRRALVERGEAPGSAEPPEWPLHQPEVDSLPGPIGVVGREGLTDPSDADGEHRHGPLRAALEHPRGAAPGQELGVGFDVLDKGIDRRRGMPNDGRADNALQDAFRPAATITARSGAHSCPLPRTARPSMTISWMNATKRDWFSRDGKSRRFEPAEFSSATVSSSCATRRCGWSART